MTMPQMPRPGTDTAATRTLTVERDRQRGLRDDAQKRLEEARETVAREEGKVRQHDDYVRELDAAIDRLKVTP